MIPHSCNRWIFLKFHKMVTMKRSAEEVAVPSTPAKKFRKARAQPKRTVSALVPRLKRLEGQVRGINRAIEKKHYGFTDLSENIAYDVNTILDIAPIIQGDSADSQRIGQKVKPYRVVIRGLVNNNHTAGCAVRLTLIQSRHRFIPDTSVATTTSGVWEQAGNANAPFSEFLWNNFPHFTVLHDELITLTGPNLDNGMTKTFEINVSKGLKSILFDDDAATYESGGLYFLMTSNLAAVANEPTIQYCGRVYYTDA